MDYKDSSRWFEGQTEKKNERVKMSERKKYRVCWVVLGVEVGLFGYTEFFPLSIFFSCILSVFFLKRHDADDGGNEME